MKKRYVCHREQSVPLLFGSEHSWSSFVEFLRHSMIFFTRIFSPVKLLLGKTRVKTQGSSQINIQVEGVVNIVVSACLVEDIPSLPSSDTKPPHKTSWPEQLPILISFLPSPVTRAERRPHKNNNNCHCLHRIWCTASRCHLYFTHQKYAEFPAFQLAFLASPMEAIWQAVQEDIRILQLAEALQIAEGQRYSNLGRPTVCTTASALQPQDCVTALVSSVMNEPFKPFVGVQGLNKSFKSPSSCGTLSSCADKLDPLVWFAALAVDSLSTAPSDPVINQACAKRPGLEKLHKNKPKKERRNHGLKATIVLRDWFSRNFEHPYPSKEQKRELAHMSFLTEDQVVNWFHNARKRRR